MKSMKVTSTGGGPGSFDPTLEPRVTRKLGPAGQAKVTTVTTSGKKWQQCAAIWAGRTSLRFCTKELGHEGDHRATGVQWNQAGQKVPITEKCP